MIKINLLSEGRAKVSKTRSVPVAAGLAGEPANLWLLAVLLLGLLVIGGRYFFLQSTIEQKEEEIAVVQKEVDELKSIIAEVVYFERRRFELEHKITVINNLKEAQRGPVEIMDQSSKALPELLWLSRMQAKGTAVSLNGLAFNTNAVANLIDNLDDVPEFAEPVLKDAAWRNGLYSFVVEFTFDPAAARTNKQAGEPVEQAAG
jgi:type IV pilus assembly protein PilN